MRVQIIARAFPMTTTLEKEDADLETYLCPPSSLSTLLHTCIVLASVDSTHFFFFLLQTNHLPLNNTRSLLFCRHPHHQRIL